MEIIQGCIQGGGVEVGAALPDFEPPPPSYPGLPPKPDL